MTEDILEKAKAADPETLAVLDWGALRDLISGLITEVERLRSLNESLMENGNDLRTRCQKAEARIKELEAALEDVGDCQSIAYMLGGKKKAEENKILIDYIKRLEIDRLQR